MDQVAGSVERMGILQETAQIRDEILAEDVEKRVILSRIVPMMLWKEVSGKRHSLPPGLSILYVLFALRKHISFRFQTEKC